jgi:hypothetical protein
MTSNQRRPGFRLPWASETEAAEAEAAAAADAATADAAQVAPEGIQDETRQDVEPTDASAGPATDAPADPAEPEPAAAQTAPTRDVRTATTGAARPESSAGFMRDLVAAMRRVAEETRQSGLSDLRTKAEEQVRTLEADSEHRRETLSARAETDVAGIGDWARAETERIKQEAEQRVVARRAQLDQQLAAETTRAEAETTALRDRVAEYERELDAYHAQLSDIADPAAFAAAAKRMPSPPTLRGGPAAPPPSARTRSPAENTNGPASAAPPIHPAEEEVLASRLAELDATLPPTAADASATPPPPASSASEAGVDSTSTEILVKGLGSFGAITGFRQALASVDGVEGVSLSLGPTGEFVFRAIHATGFDVSAAITGLEGDTAKIEPHADGGLRVTLDRAR